MRIYVIIHIFEIINVARMLCVSFQLTRLFDIKVYVHMYLWIKRTIGVISNLHELRDSIVCKYCKFRDLLRSLRTRT